MKQLQSPLPLATTLPLLSACIAATKTVIANPVMHLNNHIQDILYTIVQTEAPPHPETPDNRVRHTHTHTIVQTEALPQPDTNDKRHTHITFEFR